MTPRSRVRIGRKIADLVVQAEGKFPGPRLGPAKRSWVIAQARETVGTAKPGPSADFARWFGNHLLRIGIEVAVAVLNRLREDTDNAGAGTS